MPKKKVKDLAMLEDEIRRLQNRARLLEDELGERVDHFRDNYKKMALNSVAPGLAKSGTLGIIGGIAKTAWTSTSAKSVMTKALITALEFIGVRLGIQLVDKIRTRHKRKKAARKEDSGAEDSY
ncbi:hypothetical protein ACWKWU_08150 [Chitinophaga lutea]